MARPLRIEFPGALFHVIARGQEKRAIFRVAADCEFFLRLLDRIGARVGWQVWSYCLMPTHYHLLLETPGGGLARGMRDLNGAFAQHYNRRLQRTGHVFQGRYKALLVDRESYALQVARYIVRNPVRAGLCTWPVDWPWSSCRATLSGTSGLEILASARLLALFGAQAHAVGDYASFIRASGDEESIPGRNRGVVGDDWFLRDIGLIAGPIHGELPRVERVFRPLAEYLEGFRDRDAGIRAAYATGQYSQVEIARHCGLHYSTVCRVIRAGRCQHFDQRQDSRPDPNVPISS